MFDILVGVHQGSVLSPLLFIIVMDELSKDIRKGVPWELMFADDLALTEESELEVMGVFEKWRVAMDSKGLKVNMEKTKLMITGKESSHRVKSGRWPCGCCGKGVGVNSILCVECSRWCHQRCSGLKKVRGVKDFQCPSCKKGKKLEEGARDLITRGGRIEEVDEFCYLGNVFDCEAGLERAVRARVAAAWKKWREMASLLTNKSIPLRIRGSVYESCVRSVLLYGAEIWALTEKLEDILKSCDGRMLRYMAGVRWQDRISTEEVSNRCGVRKIQDKLRYRRLQWFGHVKREAEGGVLRLVEEMEVEGKRKAGRPRKTWKDTVQRDLKILGVDENMVLDRRSWRRIIASPTPTKGKYGL